MSTLKEYTNKNKKEVSKHKKPTGPKERELCYTIDELRGMIEAGHIPKEIGTQYLKSLEETMKWSADIQKFRMQYPDVPWDVILQRFSKLKTNEEVQMEAKMNVKIFELLWQNKVSSQLFNDVDHQNNFGISKIMAQAVYNLVGQLGTKLTWEYEDNWKAESVITDSYGSEIKLEYKFQASSQQEAERRLEAYKKTMVTKGLRIWMAYWKLANEYGRPEYTCQFIEILRCMSDKNRVSHFSTKEKQEYWNITQKLKQTTIKVHRPIGKNRTRWVEQPMVDILGGEKEAEAADTYPLMVSVRVLSQQVAQKEFAPIIYKNKTLLTHPNDTRLSYMFQTRSYQKKDGNIWDWSSVFRHGNLQGSAISNQREAKSKARRKIESFKQDGLIDDYVETKTAVYIISNKSKIKGDT